MLNIFKHSSGFGFVWGVWVLGFGLLGFGGLNLYPKPVRVVPTTKHVIADTLLCVIQYYRETMIVFNIARPHNKKLNNLVCR